MVADEMFILSKEVSEQPECIATAAESSERLHAWQVQVQQLDQMQIQIQMMQGAVQAEQVRYARAFQGLQGHIQSAYAVDGGMGMGRGQPCQQCENWQHQGYQQNNHVQNAGSVVEMRYTQWQQNQRNRQVHNKRPGKFKPKGEYLMLELPRAKPNGPQSSVTAEMQRP